MSSPKVVSETKKEIDEKAPPSITNVRQHYWLTKGSKKLYRKTVLKSGVFPVYISKRAEEKIRNHALKYGDDGMEVMGFLLGEVFEHQGMRYAVVRDVATTGLDASEVSVRFDKDKMEELFSQMDGSGFDYLIVGWYHSHPGHSCFMSRTDMKTQKAMFTEDYHSAIVIDPLSMEIEAYGMDGEDYKPVPFAVFWEEFEDPYGKKTKKKKLKRSNPD
ncbi:MAG: Mov34/MPN/PAD-1 family protein [Methanobacteriota archaeon]|nr:MAG: Mov34/MPN/PAD-1 family protein [Euryarchaeota archaeon]